MPNPDLEYLEDIKRYWDTCEPKYRLDPEYRDNIKSIVDRTESVSFMAKVVYRFKSYPETLFLAVGIFDRYVSKRHVYPSTYIAVACTALFIAAKFVEEYEYEACDIVYLSNDRITVNELLESESRVLDALDFRLGVPTTIQFLRFYQRDQETDSRGRIVSKVYYMSEYLASLSLFSLEMNVKYPGSKIAASARFVAVCMESQKWDPVAEDYTEAELTDCINDLLRLTSINFPDIGRKYDAKKYFRVSAIEYPRSIAELSPIAAGTD